MNKRMLQLMCVCIAAAVMSLGFIGCGQTTTAPDTPTTTTAAPGTGDTTSPEEPMEVLPLTIWVGSADPGEFVDQDESHRFLVEKLGVDISFMYTAGDEDEQLNLMLASRTYPDAIRGKTSPVTENYVTGGHLVEVGPILAQYAPELYAYMQQRPSDYTVDQDGFRDKFFWVPGAFGYTEEFPAIEPGLGFRYDIWRMLADNPKDLPRPQDLDEFFEMAKQMQEIQPEYDGRKTYAFSGWFADWGATWSIYAIQRFGGSHSWLGAATQANNWQRSYGFDSEEWMWAIRYLNRAYREGIGDPEAVTMNYDAYTQKLAQGIVYVNYYAGGWLDGQANRARAAAGHPEQRFVPYRRVFLR